ncbi:MAG: DUF2202 domain-containing protein [Actinobacteria bacterium]|nr:DUF2202 domain-containing protein [Actinomycetota bacterium]
MTTTRVLTIGAIAAALVVPVAGAAVAQTPTGLAPAAQVGATGQGFGQGSQAGNPLGSVPAGTLSAEMEAQLIYLAEEEQVAHDLYILAYDTYGIKTFSNISRAETRHFDVLNQALALYGLPSADQLGAPGVFSNPELQDAYDTLAAKIRSSAADAIEVGVAAEKADIADLQAGLALNPPSDIAQVLSNLVRASQNHLAAFEGTPGQIPRENARVKVSAVRNASKIRVNVDPDNPSANYRVKVQKKVNGKWRTKKVVKTKGRADVKTVNMKAGTYRVKVPAQLGVEPVVSARVRLAR